MLKFGKTPKQEDKDVRTRFKGMQLAGDISEYADYMRKQKKKQLVSMQRTNIPVPEDCLDKWLIKGLLEDLKEQTRVDNYEYDNLWNICETNHKWMFENCLIFSMSNASIAWLTRLSCI